MEHITSSSWARAIFLSIPVVNMLAACGIGIYYLVGFIVSGHFISLLIGLVMALIWCIFSLPALMHGSVFLYVLGVIWSFIFVYWADAVIYKNEKKARNVLKNAGAGLNFDFTFGWVVRAGLDIKARKIVFADAENSVVMSFDDIREYELKYVERSKNGYLSYRDVAIHFHTNNVKAPIQQVQMRSKEEADVTMSRLGIAFGS